MNIYDLERSAQEKKNYSIPGFVHLIKSDLEFTPRGLTAKKIMPTCPNKIT